MDALLETPTSAVVVDCPTPSAMCGEPRVIYSGLSREICRPLISMRAGFDLLLAGAEGPISDEQRGHVLGLRVHCDDLIRLTRTYLDYVSLVGSPRPRELGSFRLGALMDETERQFAARSRARGIAWECRLEGRDDLVETDLACFQQILVRLVENALDHTPTGGKTRVVGRLDTDDWQIEISNTGPGIPAEELTRIFEPLVRLRNGKANSCGSVDGFGMGLAICRELVSHVGAEMSLRSSADSGTSVTVRFPLSGIDHIIK